jgi:flagellar biosynthesis chaperone FliJ
MPRKEKVANLKLINDLLRTEVSSLNEQIRFLDNDIACYRKKISEQDLIIQDLQIQLAIAESKIPIVEQVVKQQETIYNSISNYLWSFKS